MQIINPEFLALADASLSQKQLELLNAKNSVDTVLGSSISDARAELFILLDGVDDEAVQNKIIENYKKIQAFRKNPPSAKIAPSTQTIPSKDVIIYCDGGASPNPGEAGSGIALYRGDKLEALYYGLYNANGTNNTAELNALYHSLLLAQKESEATNSVTIMCDSMYSINCITTWAKSWQKNGWKKKGGAIKNLDIIQKCYTLYNQLSDTITLKHIKAHSGFEGNELADRMTHYARIMHEDRLKLYEKDIDVEAILQIK